MKRFRQIIFTLAMVVGMAFSVSAQKEDKKPPPKPKPPVVDPKDKPPPRDNRPKGQDKPKKPGMSFYLVTVKKESDTV